MEKAQGDVEAAKQFRKINNEIKKKMRQADKDWIEDQCEDMKESMHKDQTRRAYETIRKLTNAKERRVCAIRKKVESP